MTKEELKDFFKMLKAVYTSDKFLPDHAAMSLWASMIEDLDYEIAVLAAKKYIVSEHFAPTVADIRKLAAEIIGKEQAVWSDGWKEVMRAIRCFGIYQEKEALASLSPMTRRVVEGIGFKEICNSEDVDVVRGQFRMAFVQISEKERENSAVPENLMMLQAALRKAFVSSAVQKMVGGSIGNGEQ